MTGRERCDRLKRIRKGLADRIGVDLHQTVCTYEGECRGTCPKCKQEEDILNAALIRKGTALAGAAVVATSLAACTPASFGGISQLLGGDDTVDVGGGNDLSGAAEPYPGNDANTDGGDEIVELSGEVAEPDPDDGTDGCDTTDDGKDEGKDTEPVDIDQIELSGDVAYIDED